VSLDFNWIVPNLAQGSFPRPAAEAFKIFNVIVYCAEEMQPRMKPPAGKFIFKIPLDDDIYRPVPADVGNLLHTAAKSIASYHLAGHPTLVTCAQGRNRSGLMNGLVLRYAYNMPARDVVKLIQHKRADALSNPMFEQYLLATSLRR
jgi:protein-tyrosine phosphatase